MSDDTLTPEMERDLRREVVHPLLFPLVMRTRNASTGEVEVSDTIEKVTIRRPTGGDLKKVQRLPDNDAEMALIAPLTGLTEGQVDRLDLADLIDIGAVIKGFVKPGRRSGATTSET